MATDDETTFQPPRAGTYADLARRMDRMELKHEDLAKDVATLTATVGQVVLNQKHAEELNELRFKSLDTAVGQIGSDLKGFMARIEGMVDGTIQTAQSRQAAETLADYFKWRKEVDDERDAQKVMNGQVRLIGRIAILLTIGGGITTLCSVVALAVTLSHP